jgi:uncharacterized protein (DUF427 family)
MLPRPDQIEPVPRRVRAMLAGHTVADSTAARYVWEWPNYPAFYLPLADVRSEFLVPGERTERSSRGLARRHDLLVAGVHRADCAWVYGSDALDGLAHTVRFDWAALDAWFEEDEQVFVHPRNPYTRVDALRSTRRVRVELAGAVLAESASPVLLFETGLPTRYYLNRAEVHERHLIASDTVTACPYKGVTSQYWSVRVDGVDHPDLAWSYRYPTGGLSAIAGLIAFYNEKVDLVVDGTPLPRPITHFFN